MHNVSRQPHGMSVYFSPGGEDNDIRSAEKSNTEI